jgi:integrase
LSEQTGSSEPVDNYTVSSALIEPMPRPRPPHLLREVSRWGTVRWVVRIGHGPRIPMPGEYGSPDFMAAYHAAVAGEVVVPKRPQVDEKSLLWLVERWRASSAWAERKPATRRQRLNILKHVLKTSGDKPFKSINSAHIIAGRERRARTPAQANNFLKVMRALFKWAVKNSFVTVNPVRDVDALAEPKNGGFPAWTQDDVDAYRARWPIGSRERLAFELLIALGHRRGDAASLGRQHLVNGGSAVKIRTEKNNRTVVRALTPEAVEAIKACPAKGLAFVAKADGGAMTKESFGNWFGESARAAGVKKNAHGLRKYAATALTYAGVTEAELDGAMGWTPGSKMSRIYTQARDDEILAARADEKLSAAKAAAAKKLTSPNQKHPIPNLEAKVGNGARTINKNK